VEHAARLAARLLEDAEHVLESAPLVDDDRQPDLVRERDLRAEPTPPARRVVA